ncbi:aldehyde dehydrogenase family protein [Streptomyces sp. NBC_01622]|uniref:aldehyde dehydrogenase family protein n=1 Tax=Streptomyces sp. NBC_01622 TaxID=2975903 RepID=UPI00386C30DF|nr:aldehyde dehydrogenase family protein [Streptomyces sp. NBC_01622]
MTAQADAAVVVDRDWRMIIGGRRVSASDGAVLDVVSPATGKVITTIPAGNSTDVDRAVDAARGAFPGWQKTSAADRGRLLHQVADAIGEHAEELARIDAIDNGSPISMLRNDVRLAVDQVRYFAGLALELRGQSIPVPHQGELNYTVHEPFGVVGRVVPFNHPLMFAAAKIAAPLIAGNTVVLKPSEHTSLSALYIGELCARVLPPGVVNVVTGLGATVGTRLTTHPDVPRVAFTGSVETGLLIQRQAASGSVKVVTLELGGKNPLLVFPDADLDAAVAGAVRGMNFTWQGQSCGSTSRVYVHRSLWTEFLARLAVDVDKLQVGDPLSEDSDVGAVVTRAQFDRVARYVDIGLADPRARLVAGGPPADPAHGFFARPTVFAFEDGACDSPLLLDEIFGPVLSVLPFDDYRDVISQANRLPLGLTASIWTSSLQTALQAVQDLEAGYVWVNDSSRHIPGAPFGGVKNSGLGREEGVEELYSYAQQKNVFIRFDRGAHSA